MLTWLSANLSTLLISLVLFAVVISIVRYLTRQKKKGKTTPGGGGGGGGGPAGAADGERKTQTRKARACGGLPSPFLTCLQFEFLLRKRIRF